MLLAANIAWTFDGFEIYALFLTVGFSLHQLLAAGDVAEVPRFAGYVLAATVFGWATGGVIGGKRRLHPRQCAAPNGHGSPPASPRG